MSGVLGFAGGGLQTLLRRRRAILAAALVAAATSSVLLAQQARPARPAASSRLGLDGVWTFSSLTPVERPQEFAGRATMTAEEAKRYAATVLQRQNADRRDGGVDADLARAYNDGWYERGDQVAYVNGEYRTSLVVDPPDGRIPALTAEAQRRRAAIFEDRRVHPADNPENRSLAERCLLFNAGPPNLPGPYNNYVQVMEFPDHVVVFNEMIHDARVIRLNGTHPPAHVRRWLGDSIGKWEGGTLVVDTTNFSDKTNFRGASDQMHLVERYTRVNDDTLLYEFTITDPAAFTKPWSVALPMKRTEEQIFEYACHEGNEAMTGMLRGARFGEKSGTP
jgi:hypothetical protein